MITIYAFLLESHHQLVSLENYCKNLISVFLPNFYLKSWDPNIDINTLNTKKNLNIGDTVHGHFLSIRNKVALFSLSPTITAGIFLNSIEASSKKSKIKNSKPDSSISLNYKIGKHIQAKILKFFFN